MSSIPVDVLLFTCAWKKRKQMILIALRNTHFCLQVGFFFSSAMCIVCFHFWIGSLTFVPVKESGTNNTQTRVFEHSTIKSSPSSYPSKHNRPPSFSKEKQSDAWSKNASLLSHWARFSPSFAHREKFTSRGKKPRTFQVIFSWHGFTRQIAHMISARMDKPKGFTLCPKSTIIWVYAKDSSVFWTNYHWLQVCPFFIKYASS